MIGLGILSPFEDVQARIKGKVGEFLQAEQRIRRLVTHGSASIRADAAKLMAIHKMLEVELGHAQTKIAQFQSGAWSIADVIVLGDVGTRLVQHVSNVTKLERRAGGVVSPSFGVLHVAVPTLGALAVGAVVLFFILRR